MKRRLPMTLTREIRHELLKKGWVDFESDPDLSLAFIASELGQPIPSRRGGPLVDRLTPMSREDARKFSMSASFGLGSFPYHTDGAYFRMPPRFVLLRMAPGFFSQRCTLLLDFLALGLSKESMSILFHDVWVVIGGKSPFLSSILGSLKREYSNGILVRYDTCCMKPAHPTFHRSKEMIVDALRKSVPVRIHWSEKRTLVIDNWRILHGREDAEVNDSNTRCLERVLVAAS